MLLSSTLHAMLASAAESSRLARLCLHGSRTRLLAPLRKLMCIFVPPSYPVHDVP